MVLNQEPWIHCITSGEKSQLLALILWLPLYNRNAQAWHFHHVRKLVILWKFSFWSDPFFVSHSYRQTAFSDVLMMLCSGDCSSCSRSVSFIFTQLSLRFVVWLCDLMCFLSRPTEGHCITALVPGGDSLGSTKLLIANLILYLYVLWSTVMLLHPVKY